MPAQAPDVVAPTTTEPAPGGDAGVHKKPKGGKADPVQQIMDHYQTTSMSRLEFVETCREQIIALIREEMWHDSERRETLSWNPNRPMA
jgi:hypothetical protein